MCHAAGPAREPRSRLAEESRQEAARQAACPRSPIARLHQAQLAVANDYGFKSWRALKAHVEAIDPRRRERDRVFDAARAGDVEAVRRAFAAGFDPATPDCDGRTIHQIAKELRHRGHRAARPRCPRRTIRRGQSAGRAGHPQRGAIRRCRGAAARLDAHPELIDALGGRGFPKGHGAAPGGAAQSARRRRLLIERGADLDRRDFPDNAAPLHFAAMYGDIETVRLLVEAGADVEGKGDDYAVGVLGWATCFGQVREDVAEYLLTTGRRSICGGDRARSADELRALIARDPALLARA